MKRIVINDRNALHNAVEIIRKGGSVVYPTDTAYGIAVDMCNQQAVKKLYALKRRTDNKPTHCIVANMAMAERYGIFNTQARMLADHFWPGPLTLIVQKGDGVIYDLPSGELSKLALRIPDNTFARKFVQMSDTPLATPSANVQGDETPYTSVQILKNFADVDDAPDVFIDAGDLPRTSTSTLVDTTVTPIQILREGAIKREMLEEVLK